MALTVSQLAFFVSDLTPSKHDKTIPIFPRYPTDVFLVMASLLDSAGAHGYFEPASDNPSATNPPNFSLNVRERKDAIDLAAEWQDESILNSPQFSISLRWKKFFLAYGPEEVRPRSGKSPIPEWWRDALFLLIAADEASVGIGSVGVDVANTGFLGEILHRSIYSPRSIALPKNETVDGYQDVASGYQRSLGSASSFAMHGRKEIANVFPKLNVSNKGISQRNFSRRLALLPNTGKVRCYWHAPQRAMPQETERTVDILLVPFPYTCSAKAFRSSPNHDAMGALADPTDRDWANFEIDPTHFGAEELEEVFEKLLTSAKEEVETVNGIIFPELSLTFAQFDKLFNHAKRNVEVGLEFAIAGARDNCEGHQGNTVLTGVWSNLHSENAPGADFCLISSRRKHHRWMLDQSQIDAYGLSSSLDPRVKWWENHICGARELHFYPFREETVFTSLICEDLARSDPCHDVLKSVGPNLVFSLLMDGPQIKGRWPQRYSDALVDDIGASVLTLTSYALVDRANRAENYAWNNTVAYFSSRFGSREIRLDYERGARGILISLTSEKVSDSLTIDGRPNPQRAWRLAAVRNIYL